MNEKHITKTLATCLPIEFLKQTNRVRKCAETWLTATDILSLRKKMPTLDKNVTKEERDKVMAEQIKKNLSAILDTILDEHPEETLELLALMCFVEPAEANDYPVIEYLNAFSQIFNSPEVVSFFVSLMRSAQTVTST